MKKLSLNVFSFVLFIALLGISLFLATGFFSCEGLIPGGTGGIEVTINAGEGASIASYAIHLDGPGGATRDKQTTGAVESFADLAVGVWTVNVTAFDDQNAEIGSSTKGVHVEPDEIQKVSVNVGDATIPPTEPPTADPTTPPTADPTLMPTADPTPQDPTVTPDPPTPDPTSEIEVKEGGNTISSGSGTYDFGRIFIDDSREVLFKIYNKGPADVTLTSINPNEYIQLYDGDKSDFSITSQPNSSIIHANQTKDFIIRFNPKSYGTNGNKTATVRFLNDSSPSPYTFTIIGKADKKVTGSLTISTAGYTRFILQTKVAQTILYLNKFTIEMYGGGGGGDGGYNCGGGDSNGGWGNACAGGGGAAGEHKNSIDITELVSKDAEYRVIVGAGGSGGTFDPYSDSTCGCADPTKGSTGGSSIFTNNAYQDLVPQARGGNGASCITGGSGSNSGHPGSCSYCSSGSGCSGETVPGSGGTNGTSYGRGGNGGMHNTNGSKGGSGAVILSWEVTI